MTRSELFDTMIAASALLEEELRRIGVSKHDRDRWSPAALEMEQEYNDAKTAVLRVNTYGLSEEKKDG